MAAIADDGRADQRAEMRRVCESMRLCARGASEVH